MKKKVKGFAVVIMLSLVSSLLFANGTAETKPSAQQGPKTSEISFMWWGNETRNEATMKAGDNFMAENPDVKVTYMPNPYSGYHDKILVQLANGTAADLFCYSTQWMCEAGFAENPVLQDLNALSSYVDFSTVDAKLLKGGMADGKLLGIPTGISGFNVSYYKNAVEDYVKKSGKAFPAAMGKSWTMDDFLAYGKDFHDVMGDGYYFLDVGDINGFDNLFIYLLSEYAGAFYMDDKSNMTFTEKNLQDTLDLLMTMTNTGVLPTPDFQSEIFSGASSRDKYLEEKKFGSVFQWTSNFVENETKARTDLVIMAYPKLGRAENDGLFVRPAQFWSISANSKNKEAAARLLSYILNSPKAALDLGLERSVPSAETGRKALAEAGMLSGNIYESTNYLCEKADASYNWFIMIPEVMEAINNEWSKVLRGKSTTKDSAARLYAQIDSVTKTMRKDNNL
jgi:ABC-type glycerol-3-phosphate transport system substrate-binding protein